VKAGVNRRDFLRFGEIGRGKSIAEKTLRADGGAHGVGQGLAEVLDVGVVFGFDHDAGELFRAGVAEDDAAVLAESGLGFGQGAGNFGESFKRRFGFDSYVDDGLRVVLETFDEGLDFTVHGN